MDTLRVIETGDGSHSLLDTSLNETYHSTHGALQESRHVFVHHGFHASSSVGAGEPLRILEIGFGTGLNTLLTLLEANQLSKPVAYESWEKHPLPPAVWQQLNYGDKVGDRTAYELIHRAPWNVRTSLSSCLELFKRTRDLLTDPIETEFDLVYYDAFAPSRQPAMWTLDVLRKVTHAIRPGGSWVSYCAKGQVKRDLASLGMKVEALPGPPGKKEMTRALRPLGTA